MYFLLHVSNRYVLLSTCTLKFKAGDFAKPLSELTQVLLIKLALTQVLNLNTTKYSNSKTKVSEEVLCPALTRKHEATL